MKDKPLKAQDIAKIAGISGNDMKRIAEYYDQVIPSRILGRVKLYEQKAAGIVENISSMEKAGKAPADIIRELGGKVVKKSARERTDEKIRADRNAGNREKKQVVPAESITSASPAGRGAVRGNEDKAAFLELKLDKLTNRVEKLEKQLQAETDARERDREEFRKIIREISENIDATTKWVDYFDRTLDEKSAGQEEFNASVREWIDYTEEEIDYLSKPFWKRRR